MGKATYRGYNPSPETAPSPTSLLTGANLKSSMKEPSPKPNKPAELEKPDQPEQQE